MSAYSLPQLAGVLEAEVLGSTQHQFRFISTDSRRIAFAQQTLFFALPGPHRSGQEFIEDAWKQGVRQFVTYEKPAANYLHDGCFAIVADAYAALQNLAAFKRAQFNYPVVGITGSNGKTIVKEWLYEALHPFFAIVRSPKSYNSQTGVPLSVWNMEASHTLAIFEAGISQPGEMEKLEQIIRPTMGIFTMLGDAHDAGFTNRQEKLHEKLKLFAGCKQLVCCTDDEPVKNALQRFDGRLYDWGHDASCWMQVLSEQPMDSGTTVSVRLEIKRWQVTVPFKERTDVYNALHVACAMAALGFEEAVINERMLQLHPLEMRLQWQKGIHNCNLLNDSYSNDMESLQAALQYLRQQGRHQRKTAMLSPVSDAHVRQQLLPGLAQLLRHQGIQRLIAVGDAFEVYVEQYRGEGLEVSWFPNTEALLQQLPSISFQHEDILIKGGRVHQFEKVAERLQWQRHSTVLEINLSKLAANLRYYRGLLQPGTKLMAMVKAGGYGSGDAEVARTLQDNGVEYLAVAFANEGVAIREAGVNLPVMVLNCPPESFATLEQHLLEPELFSLQHLQQFIAFARRLGLQHYPVHIKVDTGMHRLGFDTADLDQLAESLRNEQTVQVRTVFTHLVASENPAHDAFTNQQLAAFDAFTQRLEELLPYPFIKHAANTSAIQRHPQAHYELVRLGIGLYLGAQPPDQIARLTTTVAQIREVTKGESVGYGRNQLLPHDARIATVRIGYADGYRRMLGRGIGSMYVRGQRLPVVGNVCMDMTMLDATAVPALQVGDEVEVFGPHISLHELATWCDTIPYEILTSIGQRVQRIFLQE